MYEIRYMDVPRKRKQVTLEYLPHCASFFLGIEKMLARKPEENSIELSRSGLNTFRCYESCLPKKQQISQQVPRIRFRFQCYPERNLIIVDQLAVYDHELQELFDDE